jgi:hypothetical protein
MSKLFTPSFSLLEQGFPLFGIFNEINKLVNNILTILILSKTELI